MEQKRETRLTFDLVGDEPEVLLFTPLEDEMVSGKTRCVMKPDDDEGQRHYHQAVMEMGTGGW